MLIVPVHCTLILDSVEHNVVLFKNYWEAYRYEVFVCLEADGYFCPVRFVEEML